MTPLLRRALLFLLATALACAGEVAIPPRPAPPASYDTLLQAEMRGHNGPLTREDKQAVMAKYQAARKQWQADVRAWEASLTPAQAAELARQKAAADQARHEEFARAQRLPLPQDNYRWQDAAAKWKLTPATIERLGRDKLAYGPAVKQSFTPYLGGPVFITTDSLLNAFHVLFEDSFRRYEAQQAGALRDQLDTVLRRTRDELAKGQFGTPAPAAWRQAQLVVGPALVLLGSPIDVIDSDVRTEVEAQVAKIRTANSVDLPAWLAPAEPRFAAIDYRACKPIGFYASDPNLADYFRAVRWLQTVPFRADRDVELAAMAMLAHGVAQSYGSQAEQYFRSYASLLGPTAQRGLPDARMDLQEYAGRRTSDETRLLAMRRWLLRDDMPREVWARLAPGTLPANASELLAKIEYRVLPAYRVPDAALFQVLADHQLEPEGLAVAAMLGSDFARAHLTTLTPAQLASAEREIAPPTSAGRAPHESSLYDDYFDALRTLFAPPEKDAPAFLRGDAWQAKSAQTALAGWAQFRHTFTLQAQRSELFFGITIARPGFVEPNPEFYSRFADVVQRARTAFNVNRDRWDLLASAAQKLEALSYKQLRQEPWSAADERFLKSYGGQMGHVMGYFEDAYERPEDDAPRWTEVHHTAATDQLLAVAVGRPRTLYVLYPWNGMEILCRGSVMTYYEYHTSDRLTDPEWKALLDSPKAPAQPAWLQPYLTD